MGWGQPTSNGSLRGFLFSCWRVFEEPDTIDLKDKTMQYQDVETIPIEKISAQQWI